MSALPLKADILFGGEKSPLSALSGHCDSLYLHTAMVPNRPAL
jgi:hypothetical protein